MNEPFVWVCQSCEDWVHSHDVFLSGGQHWHWEGGETGCGPVVATPVKSEEPCEF